MSQQVEITEAASIAAEDWYNRTPKANLLAWATEHGLDIGQEREQLDADWNERVMDAYARTL